MGLYLSLCFPAESTVMTPNGAKTMSNVAVGDTVRVVTPEGRVEWSQVCGWLHREPAQAAAYQRISTTHRKLLVSATHLVATVKNGAVEYVPAGEVQAGHTLLECDTNPAAAGTVWGNKVVRVETVQAQGVYAPLTVSGTIAVDGVAASCYADTRSHKAAHASMKPMRHMWRHNPEKMAQPQTAAKHVPGSHRYVDVLAHVARRA